MDDEPMPSAPNDVPLSLRNPPVIAKRDLYAINLFKQQLTSDQLPFVRLDPLYFLHYFVIRFQGEVDALECRQYLVNKGFIIKQPGLGGWTILKKSFFVQVDNCDDAEIICKSMTEPPLIGPNATPIKVYRVIGPMGIRMIDLVEIVSGISDGIADDDVLSFLIDLIRITNPKTDFVMAQQILYMSDFLHLLFPKATVQPFGSYFSPLLRTIYSDIDMTILIEDMKHSMDASLVNKKKPRWSSRKLNSKKKDPLKDLEMYPKEHILKALYELLNRTPPLCFIYKFHYVPNARTPLLVVKYDKEMSVNLDFSILNRSGVEKSRILDLFLANDLSEKRMRLCMLFFVYFARLNHIINGNYEEEKIANKTGFNSYVLNHLLIHFVQNFSKQQILQHHLNFTERVVPYNFDEIFKSCMHFFREFFKYLALMNYNENAIYNNTTMNKEIICKCHSLKPTPLVMLDPFEPSHNIAGSVTAEGLKTFQNLIRKALSVMKPKDAKIDVLINLDHNVYLHNLEKEQNPNHINIELPEIVQTSLDFCTLLCKILKFYVSAEYVGTSQINLFTPTGVTFVTYGKAWVGRREKKRQFKNSMKNMSNLEIELAVSKSYNIEFEESTAVVRVTMANVEYSTNKMVHIEVDKGNVAEIRDAMHFLVDHFLVNNLQELTEIGIAQLENMD